MKDREGGGRPGTYAKGVRRRQEILDRALEVVVDRGLDGTSLRAIGEAIDVSHAALRHYFDSREELLLEVLQARDDLPDAWNVVDPPVPLTEQLAAVARRNSAVPGLVALYTSLLAHSVEEGNESSRKFFIERFNTARGTLADRIRAGQDGGEIPADLPVEDASALIVAVFDGLQIQWLLDPTIDIGAALRVVDRLIGGAAVAEQPDAQQTERPAPTRRRTQRPAPRKKSK